MKITMQMSNYQIECEPAQPEYGDAGLCAGWHPQLTLAVAEAQLNRHVALPASLADVDAEVFLQRMYACQR